MKNLTKSDLINIEALKAVLKMVSNDIKEVKDNTTAPCDKVKEIFKLYRQRTQLINQATEKYPHINWYDEAMGPDTSFNRSLIDTARMKIDMKFNFN